MGSVNSGQPVHLAKLMIRRAMCDFGAAIRSSPVGRRGGERLELTSPESSTCRPSRSRLAAPALNQDAGGTLADEKKQKKVADFERRQEKKGERKVLRKLGISLMCASILRFPSPSLNLCVIIFSSGLPHHKGGQFSAMTLMVIANHAKYSFQCQRCHKPFHIFYAFSVNLHFNRVKLSVIHFHHLRFVAK